MTPKCNKEDFHGHAYICLCLGTLSISSNRRYMRNPGNETSLLQLNFKGLENVSKVAKILVASLSKACHLTATLNTIFH